MKSLETLTPAQSAQQALEIERERYRSSPCLKGPGGLDKRGPTSDAVTVLRNEDGRRKVNLSRQKGLVAELQGPASELRKLDFSRKQSNICAHNRPRFGFASLLPPVLTSQHTG